MEMIKKRFREASDKENEALCRTTLLRKPQRSKQRKSSKDHCDQSARGFRLLYPQPTKLLFGKQIIVVSLHYKGRKLPVKLPLYVETKYLEWAFHQQLYRYEQHLGSEDPIAEAARIIGFESIDNDILLDYRITLGNGILDRDIDFKCLRYRREGTLERYRILKCLAIGGFSKVYLVRSLIDGRFYAMKVMSKKFIFENEKSTIISNEKDICEAVRHPFIVKLNHCFETRNFLCFVFDYCPGGELFFYLKKIKRMSEQQARFYFIEILYGLQYLHQQGIIYRDLKPENLFIDADGHIKIGDFGLSKSNIEPDTLTYSFCGSAEYMPPQMILKSGHSFGVDFYTLGALLYELVTGLPPFYSRNEDEIKDAIVNQQLTFPSRVQLSNEIKLLLKGLLAKNQKLRLGSLKGIRQILFHPWLGRVNSEQILNKQLSPPYIPDINEFNFDENELGEDEPQFTAALINDTNVRFSKKQAQFSNFQYLAEPNLRPEHVALLRQPEKVKALNTSNSVVSMKNRTFHRNNSSPYLDATSLKKSFSQDRKPSSISKCNSLKHFSKKLSKGKSNRHENSMASISFKKALKPVFRDNYFLGTQSKIARRY